MNRILGNRHAKLLLQFMFDVVDMFKALLLRDSLNVVSKYKANEAIEVGLLFIPKLGQPFSNYLQQRGTNESDSQASIDMRTKKCGRLHSITQGFFNSTSNRARAIKTIDIISNISMLPF